MTFGSSVKVAVESNGSIVGEAVGVSVGKEVGLAVSVGGSDVLVGIAACVSATTVNAMACAVPATSAALRVGGCSAPHAVRARLTINDVDIKFCFIVRLVFLLESVI